MANTEIAKAIVDLDGQEAGKQLDALKNKAKDLRDALKEAEKAGDFKSAKKLRNEIKLNSKEQRDFKKATQEVNVEMEKLNGMTFNQLRKAYGQLKKARDNAKPNTADWKKYDSQMKQVKGRMDQVNGSMGKTNKLFNSFRMLLPALGLAAGITAIVSAFKNAINISKEFEKSLSSLSAITGATGSDLDFLKNKALEFSGQTQKSAIEIVKAFELVGSIRPELLKDSEALSEVTKQAIILSEATGGKLGLEEAAKATAGSLNQFSLASDQASRVVNALAAGSKYGAAAVVNITTSIDKFGAVADAANVPIEQSIGLIETLAEKQIVGEEAGTKLRNVLIKLQEDQNNYKDGIFDVNLALDNLSNANLNVTELTKEFGKENVVAAQILIKSKDKVIEYTDAVTGTNTALEQQKIQNDNLAGALTRLGIAWDTFLIKLNQSNGWLAENLRFITAIFDVINKNDEGKTITEKIFGEDGVINEAALTKKSIKELQTELEKLETNADIYFKNWKNKTGEEKIFWATQFDIAKQNISILKNVITQQANVENGQKVVNGTTDKQAKLFTTLGEKVTELKKKLKELKDERQLLNFEDQTALDQNAQQISLIKNLITEMEKIPETFGDLSTAFTITPMESMSLEDNILSDEAMEALEEKFGILIPSLEYIQALFANPEEEEDVPGILTTYLFGKDWDDMSLSEKIQGVGNMVIDTLSDINKIISNNENQQLMEFKSNTAKKKELLNDQLNKGIISYEEYTARTAQLDEELDKKQRKIAHDQAVRNKAIAIMQAVINTAVGITAALSQMPPASYIMAALTAALGAVQIAIAASEPVPEYAAGNYQDVVGAQTGKTYRAAVGSGKTGMFSKPTLIPGLGLVGEEASELVFSGPDTNKIMNEPALIDAINHTLGVNQYAAGNAREIIRETTVTNNNGMDAATVAMLARLEERLNEPIQAVTVLDEDYHRNTTEANKKYTAFNQKVN